ncbi:hypothetical protein D3C85_1739800 [compost metagenome]
MPFRDAYKVVGEQIETGTFKPMYEVKHTHEGTIGNLMNEEIAAGMKQTLNQFGFDKVNRAIKNLIA